MASPVCFIPPSEVFEEPASSAEQESARLLRAAAQESPAYLFVRDAFVLFKNLGYVFKTVRPFRQPSPLPGVTPNECLFIRDIVLVVLLLLIQAVLLVAAIIAIPFFPFMQGWMVAAFIAFAYGITFLLERPMWGRSIGHFVVESKVQLDAQYQSKSAEEKWFFVNGIATRHVLSCSVHDKFFLLTKGFSKGMLQMSCDRLAATFKRPITAVHNRSWGLIGDIIECIIQRSFGYRSHDVRTTYACIRAHLACPQIKKVVIIAHSQGGLIMSLILDDLFAALDSVHLAKLEIYTFGSAASHFSNPVHRLLPASDPSTSKFQDKQGVVPVIEHYCNEFDMVTRWGVLFNNRDNPARPYAGPVFVRRGASGHLFDEHYLDMMFPLNPTNVSRNFLNRPVDVNVEVVDCRIRCLPNHWDRIAVDNKYSGETVRSMSKLWRYVGGGIP